MIVIENANISGFEAAIRGMRNPLESWNDSDSYWMADADGDAEYIIGERDKMLMRKLVRAGKSDAKFMRMINVTCDITAMQVWWSEFDTYKIGTVRNSCSKMHKIQAHPFTKEMFTCGGICEVPYANCAFTQILETCEQLRKDYNETKDKKYWRALIELLPEGFKLKATVQLNYANLSAMYHDRKYHKLKEWRVFCDWIEHELPLSELITGKGMYDDADKS